VHLYYRTRLICFSNPLALLPTVASLSPDRGCQSLPSLSVFFFERIRLFFCLALIVYQFQHTQGLQFLRCAVIVNTYATRHSSDHDTTTNSAVRSCVTHANDHAPPSGPYASNCCFVCVSYRSSGAFPASKCVVLLRTKKLPRIRCIVNMFALVSPK
jgi:hypothetical protein